MSAIDSLLAQLDQPDHTHVWSRDDVLNARSWLSALRAENARMREALEKIASETAATWVCDAARAALGGRDA